MEKFIQVLPIIIMIESFAASVLLFIHKQFGSSLYWFAAGIVGVAVIFGIKRFG